MLRSVAGTLMKNIWSHVKASSFESLKTGVDSYVHQRTGMRLHIAQIPGPICSCMSPPSSPLYRLYRNHQSIMLITCATFLFCRLSSPKYQSKWSSFSTSRQFSLYTITFTKSLIFINIHTFEISIFTCACHRHTFNTHVQWQYVQIPPICTLCSFHTSYYSKRK